LKKLVINFEEKIMSEIKTVAARLDIEMFVDCPSCDYMIDLLNAKETNDHDHNDDSDLLKQMFPSDGDHSDFECDGVTCTQCKTTFNVRELEW
jgi:ssDNA-binding Zn-finger/Zn-ribbon topoisomerase 1